MRALLRCSFTLAAAVAVLGPLGIPGADERVARSGVIAATAAGSSASDEYQVKAGFCYRFLFFTDWPEAAFAPDERSIAICILGRDPFGDAFAVVEGEEVGGRRLVVERFPGGELDQLPRGCHMLFVSASLADRVDEVLRMLNGTPILTVSDMEGFVDSGGMIELRMRDDRVRFEVNRAAAKRAGLDFRSRLLRLADRVVEADR